MNDHRPEAIGMNLSGFKVPLYPFQESGVEWMCEHPRALLGDDVGTGKTIEGLAYLTHLQNEGLAERALVLVPPIALTQWRQELVRKSSLDHLVIEGPPRKRVGLWKKARRQYVTLMPYSLLLRDEEHFDDIEWDVVLADEASAFKNRRCKTAQVMKRLAVEPERFVAMTATPLECHALDLFSIFECVDPTVFGNFNKFCAGHVVFKDIPVLMNGVERWVKTPVRSRGFKVLRRKVKPYFLRRTLEDVGHELPPTVVTPIWAELSGAQARAMAEAQAGCINTPEGELRSDIRGRILRQLQCCDSLRCFSKSWKASVKLDILLELLEGELSTRQVVVFGRFRTFIEQIAGELRKRGISNGLLTSKVSRSVRDETIEAHRAGDKQVLLMTTAGERALNLQHCQYIIMMNLLYNPARNRQIIGRIRRIGQELPTVVMALLVQDSIEEALLDVLSERVNMVRESLGFKAELWDVMTAQELRLLARGKWEPIMRSEGDERVREALL